MLKIDNKITIVLVKPLSRFCIEIKLNDPVIKAIDDLPNYIIELPGMENVIKIFNKILEDEKDE